MIDRLPLIALLVVASLPAAAAGPGAKRNFSVTSFDRIRVDGPYDVHLTTNVAPFARASGASNTALDGVAIRVEGRTLVVGAGQSNWGGYPGESKGPVTIDLGTPNLSVAWLNGPGSLSIDRAKGLSFELSVNGAGTAKIGQVDVDQLKVGISGAGSARFAGKALRLTAIIRGPSSFDGEALTVKDATIGAEGPAIVRLTATETAKVDALGLAAVTLGGKPSCVAKAKGSASITGCK